MPRMPKGKKRHTLLSGGRWVLHSLGKRKGYATWIARVRDTRDNSVRYHTTSETRKDDALRSAMRWLEEIERGEREREQSVASKVLLAPAFEEWLSLKDVRPATLACLKIDFEKIYKPQLGDRPVPDVQLEDIERFVKHLGADRNCGARTKLKHVSCLRSFFRWCIRRRYRRDNPCEGVTVGRGTKKFEPRALTVEEQRKLLAACQEAPVLEVEDFKRGKWKQSFPPPSYLSLCVLVALRTGLRRRNATGLRWEQVDLEKRRLHIRGEEMKGHRPLEIPLHQDLLSELRRVLAGAERVPAPDESIVGRDLLRFDKAFKSALLRAGLSETVRFHDLRHSFASLIAGVAAFHVLRDLLGHGPGNAITGQYAHASWEEKLAAIDALPSIRVPPKEKRKVVKTGKTEENPSTSS